MFRRHQSRESKGVSRRIFVVFALLSFATLGYLNMISDSEMRLVAGEFPEWSESMRETVLRSYKMAVSIAIFFIDLILVGPFAYLSYFGQHIKPKVGHILNRYSFFDFGLVLASIFTLFVAAAHMIILDIVSPKPAGLLEIKSTSLFFIGFIALWALALFFKIHSYTRDQRKELKKYLIRF